MSAYKSSSTDTKDVEWPFLANLTLQWFEWRQRPKLDLAHILCRFLCSVVLLSCLLSVLKNIWPSLFLVVCVSLGLLSVLVLSSVWRALVCLVLVVLALIVFLFSLFLCLPLLPCRCPFLFFFCFLWLVSFCWCLFHCRRCCCWSFIVTYRCH